MRLVDGGARFVAGRSRATLRAVADVTQGTDAIAELARMWKRYEGDPDGAIRAITETAAHALNVRRAGVWLLAEEQSELTCVDLFDSHDRRHTSGTVVRASEYPRYFGALLGEDPIAASDAHADPRTSEFSPTYLAPANIGALLDAPIRTGMRLVGVLCHEHVGGSRRWETSEIKDAAFLASLASLTLELRSRAKREALLAATLESTAEGIFAADESRVLAFNQRFLDIWRLDSRAMRSLDEVRDYIERRTVETRLVRAADEALAGAAGHVVNVLEIVDEIELDDGRVLERCSRPQKLGNRVIGRVWSFRDVTAQRRAEAALRANEAKMRDLATRDELTGLWNRRHILDQLQRELESKIPLCVALVDLDHFKRINDEHGHLVGDSVLRDFAQQLREHFRASDHVGRYGGEEFLVVLRDARSEAAHRLLESFRSTFRDRTFVPRYTFSAGVAEHPADGEDTVALLSRADVRLYEAKRLGRDRTVTRIDMRSSTGAPT